MNANNESEQPTVVADGGPSRRTYTIIAATTSVVVFGLLAYALSQIVVKLDASEHTFSFFDYKARILHGGTLLSIMDRDVAQYLNLRYAQVLERFGPAQPYAAKRPGDEVHSQPHPCAHGPYSAFPAFPLRAAPEHEDCLFLNVWAPFEPVESGNGFTRPVVVVLVGGNFVSGGSSDHEFFDGSIMASTWDQVIVVPNYRVGVLGFYTAVTANASHDAGIQDQLLALQWVNRHITKYGGDPNRVTLLGHEAGATAVGFHLLSPDSSELFARAILLSGSPYRPLPARDGTAIGKISRELLCIRNGSDHSGEHVARCLKTKSVRALLDRQRAMTLNGAVAAFSPSFAGTSLPEVLSQVAETGRFGDKGRAVARKPKQILVGSTHNEGSAYVMALLSFYGAESERSLDIRTTSHILETYLERHGVIGMGEEILRAYMLRNEAAYRSPVSALERAIGDFAVNCPMKRFLESYAVGGAAGGGDVYVYYFTHVPHFRWWPYWMGAPQMLDWLYVSGNLQKLRRAKINVTDSDTLLSMTLASLVSCFAWTGKPDSCKQTPPVHWPKVIEGHLRTLVVVNATSLMVNSGLPYDEACVIWDTLASQTPAGSRDGVSQQPPNWIAASDVTQAWPQDYQDTPNGSEIEANTAIWFRSAEEFQHRRSRVKVTA